MNLFKTLVVNHVGDTPEEDSRVAIAPDMVKYVSSKPLRLHGRDLMHSTVYLMDGDLLLLNLSSIDLSNLEECIAKIDSDY